MDHRMRPRFIDLLRTGDYPPFSVAGCLILKKQIAHVFFLLKKAGLLRISNYFLRQPGYPLASVYGWWGSYEFCCIVLTAAFSLNNTF